MPTFYNKIDIESDTMTHTLETCDLIGVKPDGSSVNLGKTPLPARMKMREITVSYLEGSLEDEMSEASMGLLACEEFFTWWQAQQVAVKASALERVDAMMAGWRQDGDTVTYQDLLQLRNLLT